jgi:hypothetical protein
MFPSGSWDGFWHQNGHGRQSMTGFELQFKKTGLITGKGIDIIGPFIIDGTFEKAKGQVTWIKRYLGKHTVYYSGLPDGEGCIAGTWKINGDYSVLEGSFLIRPVLQKPSLDDQIREIRPKN